MFQIKGLDIKNEGCDVRSFCMQAEKGATHVILSSNVMFLTGIMNILLREESISSGNITVEQQDFFSDRVYSSACILSAENTLFNDMTVADNVFFSDRSPFLFSYKKKCAERMKWLSQETGFYFKPSVILSRLTHEQQKIVELLKCYYEMPNILIVQELATRLAFNNYTRFLNILDKLKEKGCIILYLTSQWEEAVKVADKVTVVSNGDNYGTYEISELKENPSEIYYLLMGGKRFLADSSSRNDDVEMFFKAANDSLYDITSGFNLEKTLQGLTLYLTKRIKASSCVIYLNNERQDSILDIVSNAESSNNSLRPEVVFDVIKKGTGVIYFDTDPEFDSRYVLKPSCRMTMVFPILMSSVVSGLIQLDFSQHYEFSEYDEQFLNWVIKEIGIVVENSRLMGRSVLLQESYHRIKNNLQVIISLMEMEKNSLAGIIDDEKNLTLFDDVLNKVINRIRSIANVHNLMAQDKVKDRVIDLYVIINEVCRMYYLDANISLDFDLIYIPYSKAISVALVINELISNSIKHNQGMNDLALRLTGKEKKKDQKIIITCRDNGKGFLHSDGSEVQDQGVGTKIIRSIVCNEFGGEIRFSNDGGALAEVEIPILDFLKMK